MKEFTFVRLSKLDKFRDGLLYVLDEKLPRREVITLVELPDESWELVMSISYVREFVLWVGKNLPGASVDQTYNPCEPTEDSIVSFGYDVAKAQCMLEFSNRVAELKAWPDAILYYTSYLTQQQQCYNGETRALPHLPPSSPPKQQHNYEPLIHEAKTPLQPTAQQALPLEQVDWIHYFSADLQTPLESMDALFRLQFGEVARSVVGSFLVRKLDNDWAPVLDKDGIAVWEGDEIKMIKVRPEDKDKSEWRDLPWTLVTRFPNLASKYEWVREEDQEVADRLWKSSEARTSKLRGFCSFWFVIFY